MEHENYVSLKTAKNLKKAGFIWGCNSFYGLDVRHNGESIDFDEECELKSEGKESEIEYVDGGTIYSFYHSNKEDEDYGGYSRPTLAVAQKWLREAKKVHIEASPENDEYTEWLVCIYDSNHFAYSGFKTYEEAVEYGINKFLKEDHVTDKCSEE